MNVAPPAGGTRAGQPPRGGPREIVLRAYAAKTPDASRPGYSGSPPGRIAGDLRHVLGAGHGYSLSLP